MVRVTINGKTVEVPEGANLIEAAKLAGVAVAHFCYHPALSIVGQCRMCLCEIEKNPKLQIACNTRVQEGMVVHFDNPRVEETVKRTLEFHLVNHPIDCPICDQAGECVLQDYYMLYGKHKSQVPLENKVLKRKVVDLGPRIMLDQERCILCSRCVRFTTEISKTNELGYFNRGDRAAIATVNDKPLTGNYQENLADICPVGALTSKDFRFECRVWYLDSFDTLCTGCSMGCNVTAYHKKQKRFFRLKPRYNPKINGYWMCDEGRSTYKLANYDRRLVVPIIDEARVDWSTALESAVPSHSSLDPNVTALWLSPQLTNEEIFLALTFFNKTLNCYRFYSEDTDMLISKDDFADGLLFRRDRNPNSRGLSQVAKALKINVQKTDFLTPLLGKTIKTLMILAPDFEGGCPSFPALIEAIPEGVKTIVFCSQASLADRLKKGVFLPTLSALEKQGTITNFKNITQPLNGRFKMFPEALPLFDIVSRLAGRLRVQAPFASQQDVARSVAELLNLPSNEMHAR